MLPDTSALRVLKPLALAGWMALAGGVGACAVLSGLDGYEIGAESSASGGGGSGAGGGGFLPTVGASGGGTGGQEPAGGTGGAGGGGIVDPDVGCDPVDPTLLACFSFDDDDAADASSFHRAVDESNLAYENGIDGRAARMNASSYIRLGASADWNVSAFTVEMWFRIEDTPNDGARSGLFDSDGRMGMWIRDEAAHVSCAGQGTELSGGDVPLGTWTHLACVHDGVQMLLYRNGVLLDARDTTVLTPSNGTVAIGGNAPSGDPFLGLLDGVRVYNVARTDAQICADAGRTDCPAP
ncbi:LamG domain-containing protein [Chondromyces apiculatus]|uniref:Putative transmembrane protein n=1 Tax=Chondromyces apiculatus DSM 436 TaxID=1192034 RepID=A0A017T156_9BACT|nr:LamG domain-containing protein [Chondromyces apiculatus]EYF02301.1 putative transmembrane protein [Chondromyces apiculatus DSM 436]